MRYPLFIYKGQKFETETELELKNYRYYDIVSYIIWTKYLPEGYENSAKTVQAPKSDFFIIDGPGHNVQYSTPKEFADAVKYVLEK